MTSLKDISRLCLLGFFFHFSRADCKSQHKYPLCYCFCGACQIRLHWKSRYRYFIFVLFGTGETFDLCLEHFLSCHFPCFSSYIPLSIPHFRNYFQFLGPTNSLPLWTKFQALQPPEWLQADAQSNQLPHVGVIPAGTWERNQAQSCTMDSQSFCWDEASWSLENWKLENKQPFIQSQQHEGEYHQLLPASMGLTIPECPFLSFSLHLWPASTRLLCLAWGHGCCMPGPGLSGQQKEKQGGHCQPQWCWPGCQAELSQEELGCPLGALPTKKDSLKGQSHGPTGSQGGRLNNGLAVFNRHQSPQLGDRGVRPPFKRVKPNTLKDYSCSVGLIQEGWTPATHCTVDITPCIRNSSFSKKACTCERGSNKSWQRRSKSSVISTSKSSSCRRLTAPSC